MLHIVNGDSFAGKLRESGIEGHIMVWRESFYEGPVGLDHADKLLLEARSYYMEKKYSIPRSLFTDSTLQQEQAFLRIHANEPVVLWFEHDLYDQLMLCYLLNKWAVAGRDLSKLYLLSIGKFPGIEHFQGFGQLSPQQVASLNGAWKPVTKEQLSLGVLFWNAYVASDPEQLEKLMHEDLSVLPFLKAVLLMHMGRFPSTRNGLNALQHLVLNLIQNGESSFLSGLFTQTGQLMNGYGLGDLQFWGIIEQMRLCKVPLLSLQTEERLPKYNEAPPKGFEDWRLKMTGNGSKVHAGHADHIILNEIDDWIGGIRLIGDRAIWRWDAIKLKLVRS